jgi:NAD(P)-dependent dehydrogenase (short-subunit alcohol dehydrogenase family)
VKIDEQVAIVTGADSGLGRAMAVALAHEPDGSTRSGEA